MSKQLKRCLFCYQSLVLDVNNLTTPFWINSTWWNKSVRKNLPWDMWFFVLLYELMKHFIGSCQNFDFISRYIEAARVICAQDCATEYFTKESSIKLRKQHKMVSIHTWQFSAIYFLDLEGKVPAFLVCSQERLSDYSKRTCAWVQHW